MRCGIPLLGERVAPRCTGADSVLLVSIVGRRVASQARLRVTVSTPMELLAVLQRHHIDTLVCGGISRDVRDVLIAETVQVVDNVAGTPGEILPALEQGTLRSGYGLHCRSGGSQAPDAQRAETARAGRRKGPETQVSDEAEAPRGGDVTVDCLRCKDPICLSGANCLPWSIPTGMSDGSEIRKILEAAADVSLERERRLCRLAELVYFCLEMRYQIVGLAYCVDLQEPAQILASVLRRFFKIVPVCCKVGGTPQESPTGAEPVGFIACNPVGQAMLLNRAGTDINVIVGLCVGADTVFAGASEAPITTLFVKDKSLANNPIGALYSQYYLKESLSPSDIPGALTVPLADGDSEVFEYSRVTPQQRGPKEEP